MQKQPLEYFEFFEQLWGSISATIVSEEYLNEHSNFIDALTFNLYRRYEMDENLQMSTIKRIMEDFFFAYFRFNNGR